MSRPAAPPRAPGERYVERDEGAEGGGAMGRGARVVHEKFGRGVILSVDPGVDPIVTVEFSGWGTKRIKARFLREG